MGTGASFAEAYGKAQLGAGEKLPRAGGNAFLSVREMDRPGIVSVAKRLQENGFSLIATRGTAGVLQAAGLTVEIVNKVNEGRPHIVDLIKNGKIQLIVNTTEGRQAIADSATIRRSALQHKVYYNTTLAGADASSMALAMQGDTTVRQLQTLHEQVKSAQ